MRRERGYIPGPVVIWGGGKNMKGPTNYEIVYMKCAKRGPGGKTSPPPGSEVVQKYDRYRNYYRISCTSINGE